VSGKRRRCERRGIEQRKRALGLVEASDQQQAPDLEIPCMRGIDAVAVCFERCLRRVERLRGPRQVSRGERDLGLRDDASCAGNGFPAAVSVERLFKVLRALDVELALTRAATARSAQANEAALTDPPPAAAKATTARSRRASRQTEVTPARKSATTAATKKREHW